jgi:hypothetical protein
VAVHVIRERAELVAERDLPRLIQAFNAAKGIPDAPARGYNETVTIFHLRVVRAFLEAESPAAEQAFHLVCNGLLASPLGDPALMWRYYSRELLFSPEAKARFVPPDLRPLELA